MVDIRIGKQSFEVLASTQERCQTTRFVAEVLHDQQADPDADLQIGNMGIEALAHSSTPLTPCSLPAFWEFFSHNFATVLRLETQCRTAITRGADSLSENRTQIFQRPRRTISVRWSEKGSVSQANLMRLMQVIRSDKTNNWVVPLYCDAGVVSVPALTGETILEGQFERRRFFLNGLVAVVKTRGPAGEVQDEEGNLVGVHITTLLDQPDTNKIQLTDPLPFNVSAQTTCVMPLICVYPRMQDTIQQHTAKVWDTTMEFEERGGPTAIPFMTTDLPAGFDVYRGRPILRPRHDYTNPLNIEIFQEGEQVDQGRGIATYPRGASQRVKHRIRMIEERDPGWDYIQFFESRRGRFRSFWMIDQEALFSIADLETNFIDVVKLGDFSEFEKDTEYFGFMMKDGTCYVREISTIQDLPTDWRLTVVEALPAGLNFQDVCLAGRARPTRMLEDTLLEEWFHNNAVRFEVSTLSLLKEETITLDP